MSRPISASYLERKLRAIAGVQGDNPLPDLADLAGLLVLEDDRVEWCLPGGELLGWAVSTQAAIAAQFGFVALVNPKNSGVIAVIEQIRTDGACDVFVADPTQVAAAGPFLAGETANSSIEFLRDTRSFKADSSTPQQHVCRVSTGSNVVSPWHGPVHNIPSNFPNPIPCILGPDTALVVVRAVVNFAVVVSFVFRERPIEGSVEVR